MGLEERKLQKGVIMDLWLPLIFRYPAAITGLFYGLNLFEKKI